MVKSGLSKRKLNLTQNQSELFMNQHYGDLKNLQDLSIISISSIINVCLHRVESKRFEDFNRDVTTGTLNFIFVFSRIIFVIWLRVCAHSIKGSRPYSYVHRTRRCCAEFFYLCYCDWSDINLRGLFHQPYVIVDAWQFDKIIILRLNYLSVNSIRISVSRSVSADPFSPFKLYLFP